MFFIRPVGIHVTLADTRGGTLIYWKGRNEAADSVILDALEGDADR